MKENVLFISVWNGGFEVTTNACYDLKTKKVSDIEGYQGELVDTYGDKLEILDGRFIELVNGKRLAVTDDENDESEGFMVH